MATLNMRIPQKLDDRLSALAEKTGRTKTYYVLEMVNGQIDELEDLYLAEAAYREFQKSGAKPVSLKEAELELDS